LEAAYFEWKAAVERIDVASAYPNSNVELRYEYMFSSESMKSFDRMTFSAGFDPMETLQFPTKVQQAGKVALDQARETGERFRFRKFELQRRVLTAWADYGLIAERLRIERENLSLLQLTFDTAAGRVRAGASQSDLLRAEVDLRMADDRIKTLEAELDSARVAMNAMLARQPEAPLIPPAFGSDSDRWQPIAADDAALIAAATDQNPELAALARQVDGRTDALELARMQWIPDISPSVAFTGGIAQAIGIAISLPTTVIEIQGTIKEAQAMLRASEAMLRQTQSDRSANVIATLIAMRNSERQAVLFETLILPAAQRIQRNIAQAYGAGTQGGTFLDLLTSQRALLEVQLTVATARTDRQRRLAELEALIGVDTETILKPLPDAESRPEPNEMSASLDGGGA
jgi:outer membrane protein TolC